MSETDSFIEEVTEEVRRDRLFKLYKKWGWVAGVAVLAIVGGAAFNEWSKANSRATAQAFGDAILAGIDAEDPTAALAAIETTNPAQTALARHLAAAAALASDKPDEGLAALDQIAALSDVPEIYKTLAGFKRALALPADAPAEERIAAFDAQSGPGMPFRHLAQEQKAMVLIETGKTDDAIAILQGLLIEAEVTAALQRRASEMILALGGDQEAG